MSDTSNFVSLKEYIEQRFSSNDRAVASALAASKEATTKSEVATEKRFDGVNEFRQTLSDQQRTLMPRSEAEQMIKSLNDRIKIIEDSRLERFGESGGAKNVWGYLVGGSGFIIAGLTLLLRLLGR